jgi:uncharacterized protein (DUF697 family)/GTP-binding protein EngB required for normal cell division
MVTNRPEDWLTASYRRAYQEQKDELGRFNLAIFGKTGVGKSTLVNAIFGNDVAKTGIGEPVTTEENLYIHDTDFLSVLDTRGVEVGVDNDKIIRELSEYITSMRRKPMSDQLHIAWYCVRFGDRRFEDTEAEFVRQLHKLGLPVILVLTQVPMRDGVMHHDVEVLVDAIKSRGLPIYENTVFPVMAKADPFIGEEHGLIELLDATFRAAPEGVRGAINAAQKIDQERKRREATVIVKAAAGAAAAAGATPIPFSDAVILVPIQMTMMAKISQAYGMSLERSTAVTLAATAAATATGRSVVTSLIKFVPGAGTVAGGTIAAGVASTITYAMGLAWLAVCERLARGELVTASGALDNETIRRVFLSEFKSQVRRRKKS